MNFKTLWALFGPRLIGGAASVAAGLVFAKTRGTVSLDPQQIVEVAGTMIATYGLSHKAASVKINPSDAAAPRLIEANETALATGTAVKPAAPQTTRYVPPVNR